ncbi:unnamed protein product, partial [Diamesa serratosioi]
MADKKVVTSSVSPPTELPSFILQQQSVKETPKAPDVVEPEEKFVQSPTFTPAIPAVINPVNPVNVEPPKDLNLENNDFPSMNDIASALSPLTEKSSVLFGWLKETMNTGVQKAKESVDTLVTTLDPQMRGIIYSGGTNEFIVASASDDKVNSVREAFQSVFGRATVTGYPSQSKTVAAQPVGWESAEKSAEERISNLRSNEAYSQKVIVAVENFIVEIYKNQWFDVGLLLLSDPQRNITLKTFTQMTSIPSFIVTTLDADTPAEYERKSTGFSTTIGHAMGRNLNTPHYEWHKTYTTIDRTEMIINAATSLASIYKLQLAT